MTSPPLDSPPWVPWNPSPACCLPGDDAVEQAAFPMTQRLTCCPSEVVAS